MTSSKSKVREYTEAIVLAIILALFIRAFIVQAFKIPSGSMDTNAPCRRPHSREQIYLRYQGAFTDQKVFAFHEPQRGDVIVFYLS